MPRRNIPARTRRARKAAAAETQAPSAPDVAAPAPPGHEVRFIQPARAVKEYRCPGCNQEIRPGTGHVVAWRIGDEEGRRHWHRGCWDSEARRRSR